MKRFNWMRASQASKITANGSEQNVMLPLGEGVEEGTVDPDYVAKKSVVQKILEREPKDPGPKFSQRVKPFSFTVKRRKKLSRTNE